MLEKVLIIRLQEDIKSLMSSGQRQEQSGRLARNSLCLGVCDYSSKFTQSASDWRALEGSVVTARRERLRVHTTEGRRKTAEKEG